MFMARWAAACIKSRTVYAYDAEYQGTKTADWLKTGTCHDSSALCPWFDMLNHGDTEQVNSGFEILGSHHLNFFRSLFSI